MVRIWLRGNLLFEPDPNLPGAERLTDEGKQRIDSAMATFVDRLPGAALIVEGYSQSGTKDQQHLQSRLLASLVRDYLIDKFQLDARMTTVMPLGSDSEGSPDGESWDGVALAVFQENTATAGKPR
jgi:hypothetical protein